MTLSYDDAGRYARLSKVVELLNILDLGLPNCIDNLDDHKGRLTVTWIDTMNATEINKSILNKVWAIMGEHEVEHEILKKVI